MDSDKIVTFVVDVVILTLREPTVSECVMLCRRNLYG